VRHDAQGEDSSRMHKQARLRSQLLSVRDSACCTLTR
jgi:hypothetical protein